MRLLPSIPISPSRCVSCPCQVIGSLRKIVFHLARPCIGWFARPPKHSLLQTRSNGQSCASLTTNRGSHGTSSWYETLRMRSPSIWILSSISPASTVPFRPPPESSKRCVSSNGRANQTLFQGAQTAGRPGRGLNGSRPRLTRAPSTPDTFRYCSC
jgi:hypothetical protein